MKFVVVGAGLVGTSLASKLLALGYQVSLIDRESVNTLDHNAGSTFVGSKKITYIQGSGASPEALISAGIEEADYLIAVADSDEVNVAACFISRLITPKPKRIARIRNYDLHNPAIPYDFLDEYFDLIINPEKAATDQLLRTMQVPGAHELLEFAEGKIRVLGLTIEPESPLSNMKLSALKDWPEQLPVLIVAVMRGSKLIIPTGEDRLIAGDVIYAVSHPEKTSLLFELAGKKAQTLKRLILSANDHFASTLCQNLQKNVSSLTIVVPNKTFKEELQENFKKVKVICGDVREQAFLDSLGIKNYDVFIAATSDDENNILTALLAKRMGIKSAGVVISNQSYGSLVSAVGLDVVINLRLAAANAIFQHIHHHSVISEFSLQNEGAGFIEIELDDKSDLTDKKIKDLKLPDGVLITALERGDQVIIPKGDDSLMPGDKALIFLLRASQQKLEKRLGFQLELFI